VAIKPDEGRPKISFSHNLQLETAIIAKHIYRAANIPGDRT